MNALPQRDCQMTGARDGQHPETGSVRGGKSSQPSLQPSMQPLPPTDCRFVSADLCLALVAIAYTHLRSCNCRGSMLMDLGETGSLPEQLPLQSATWTISLSSMNLLQSTAGSCSQTAQAHALHGTALPFTAAAASCRVLGAIFPVWAEERWRGRCCALCKASTATSCRRWVPNPFLSNCCAQWQRLDWER